MILEVSFAIYIACYQWLSAGSLDKEGRPFTSRQLLV